jgi:O-antigen/teichoic acid export membrane protein
MTGAPAGGPSPAARNIGAGAIRRGIALSAVGAVVPAVVAVFCVRAIDAGLGHERFGVLSLAWVFVNSVGILDLGIGRALTRFLAVREEQEARREAGVVWASLATILALGVAGGALAFGLSDVLAGALARGDAALRGETAAALRILALSIPCVVVASGLRGILDAFGRFDLSNGVAIPIAILNLVAPVVLLRLGASLGGIVGALVALRLAGTLALLRLAVRTVPAMSPPHLDARGIRPVLAFAGWVTVSNLAGPLFIQAERYLLGLLGALSLVAFYATPADVLARVTVIPSAALQVLFPVLAQALQRDRARAARLAERGLLLIAAAILPVLTALVAFAPELLALWLGPEFAAHAARPARLLAVATFVNSMAWLPFSVVQSAGLARWTARLHLVEIPLYIALLVAAIHGGGIDGAALASLVRAAVDGAVVAGLASRAIGAGSRVGRRYAALVTAGLVAMTVAAAMPSLALRAAWAVLALATAAAIAWRLLGPGVFGTLSTRAAEVRARLWSVP